MLSLTRTALKRPLGCLTSAPARTLHSTACPSRALRSFPPLSGWKHAAPKRAFSAGRVARQAHAAAGEAPLPKLAPPAVGRWLLASSGLVFGIIVVGGVTRLTESGLSITEWKPITGIIPPLDQAAWEEEFAKYKSSPEFKL
jgi:cytochrome c oxidase assembly protein subunit 15